MHHARECAPRANAYHARECVPWGRMRTTRQCVSCMRMRTTRKWVPWGRMRNTTRECLPRAKYPSVYHVTCHMIGTKADPRTDRYLSGNPFQRTEPIPNLKIKKSVGS